MDLPLSSWGYGRAPFQLEYLLAVSGKMAYALHPSKLSLILRLVAMMEPTRAMCMSLCCSLDGTMAIYRHGNSYTMMCMDGTGPKLSNCLLICGIGV